MPEILFARNSCFPNDLIGDDSEVLGAFRAINDLQPNDRLTPGSAYTLDIGDPQARPVVSTLNRLSLQQRMSLARGAGTMGDETHRLAAFFEQVLSPEMAKANSLIGAGATAGHAHLTGLQKALLSYQEALLDLKKLQSASHAGPGIGTRRSQAEGRARAAFRQLQMAYRNELDRLAPEVFRNSNRGGALSNADRGITLARRNPNARPDPRLHVADTFQARRLAAFAKFLDKAGKGALALDAVIRARGVYDTHQEGGQWMREAAVQTTGFGAGAAAGLYVGGVTVNAGIALTAGLAASGPVGWAILGVVVGVGLLAGFGAGYYMDRIGQSAASLIWDMNWNQAWNQLWDWAW